jgi:protein-glucosylgalactosylhydroxylysine glucosidase
MNTSRTRNKIAVCFLAVNSFFSVSIAQTKINRQAVVQRHTILNTRVDSLESLSVGNGKFAFTVDVTGLQTFPERYAKGVSLGTQSEWGWNRLKDTAGYQFEEVLKEYTLNGKKSKYAVQFSEQGRQRNAADWFRKSTHRLQLGNLGLDIYKKDGSLVKPSDIKNIKQTLNMWTGEITSHFAVEGVPVDVVTIGHQELDAVAAQIKSPLIQAGRLKLRLRFPYPTIEFLDEGVNYKENSKHTSSVVNQSDAGAALQHKLEGITYYTTFKWSNKAEVATTSTPHYFQVSPDKASDSFAFTCLFSPEASAEAGVPTFSETKANSNVQLKAFWNSGAAIDFAGSTDPRAKELERRVVTSQYLTKIQCTGSFPPQETGLTFNSWFGKPHLEMHWWHSVHFALWDREKLMEKSLDWYFSVEDKAKQIAARQGFKGARWQKMTDHEGLESPSSVGAFIIWQQPHPIYMAELLYRDNQDKAVLDKYKEMVFQTADFMASFTVWDSVKQRYNLGKGLIPAQEVFKAVDTYNPPYELAYWDWALRTAQKWKERLGMPRDAEWDKVISKLAPFPKLNGVYLSTENTPDSFTNEEWLRDHPSVLGALGMVPASPKLDRATMQRTFDTVWKTWQWPDTWGWDFPMTAMTAARLGKPEKAIDALFMNIKTNTYLKNGHNYQDGRLRIYLPGNGGVLATVAMLAGGWDGSVGQNPGFPKNGKWKVKSEGFKKMP